MVSVSEPERPPNMIFSITLDPHPIKKQAGTMEHAASNVAGLHLIAYMYRSANKVFTAEVTGQNG